MIAKVTNKAIFSSSIFSINFVTYPTNHSVMNHIDHVQHGRYYKLNFVLIKPQAGGVFKCSKCIVNLFNRVYLFRPDMYEHSVSKIDSGKRVLLSFALNI
ncbi:2OG-Fe(II) oxygenase [Candidatus Nitrotoga sp. M5]|nr:2OG-Fe(II) oxygenase [Candidatus Nitrotoga sp. M5]